MKLKTGIRERIKNKQTGSLIKDCLLYYCIFRFAYVLYTTAPSSQRFGCEKVPGSVFHEPVKKSL